MTRTPHEGMCETALRILTQASNAYPALENRETFAKVIDSILEQVGANFRITLDTKTKTTPWEDTGEPIENTLEAKISLQLLKTDPVTWEAVRGMAVNEALWRDSPFKPALPISLQSVTWMRALRALLPEAFGPSLAEPTENLLEKFSQTENDVFETYPSLKEYTESTDDEDKRRILLFAILPNDLLRPNNKFDYMRCAEPLARLASRRPEIERHATLHAINALRLHQSDAVLECASQGLRTLRDTEHVGNSRYFEHLLSCLREDMVKLYRAIAIGTPGSEEAMHAMVDVWDEKHPDEEETEIERSERRHGETVRVAEWLRKQVAKDDLKAINFEDDKKKAKAFLRAFEHAEHPVDEVPQKLREVIDAPRCREELESARMMFNADALGAKELEIVSRTMNVVLRFPHAHPFKDVSEPDPNCCTPRFVREQGKINCFTGPWLVASLLLECGMTEEQLLYCDVQGAAGGNVTGAHGSLLVLLSSGQQVVVDVSFKRIKHLQLALYDEKTHRQLDRLITGEARIGEKYHMAPVRAVLPETLSQQSGIHSHMYVMPMRSGFAWGSLLTTGTAALEGNDVPLARHSFELAHRLHPESPDTLGNLAECAKREGNEDEAHAWLKEALRSFPGHLMSRYRRAVLRAERKEHAGALEDLEVIEAEPKAWYGGKRQREHATALLRIVRNLLHMERKAASLREKNEALQTD